MKTLKPLELLVQELFKKLPEQNDQEWTDRTIELITAEQNRAIQKMRETIYHFNGDRGRMSAHVEYLQTEISKVSDHYFSLLKDSHDDTPGYRLISILLSALNSIYRYLMETYVSVFNDQLKVPLALKQAFAAENQKMAARITRALTASGEDKALVKLIGDYLSALSKPVYRPINNSRELNYQLNFVKSLYLLVSNHTGAELRNQLFIDLVRLNFNYYPVICHYIQAMQTSEDEVGFYDSELNGIAKKIRDLRSIPVKENIAYEPGHPSLSEILAKALKEEEAMLNKRLRILSRVTYKKWEAMLFTPFYLRTSATMEQAIYFFRVFMEIGFFTAMKKVIYFDYISKHIETDKQQGFSTGYVKNKFNNPRRNTAERIKEYCLQAIRWIDDHPPMD